MKVRGGVEHCYFMMRIENGFGVIGEERAEKFGQNIIQ